MALTTSWQLIGEKYVGATSYGNVYLRQYARYSTQDIANNRSYVYYETRLYLTRGTFYSGTTTTAGIGSNLGQTWGVNKAGNYSAGEVTLLAQEGWVGHDANGNLTMSFGAAFYSSPYGWNATNDVTADLPTIPRYANITSFSVSKIDETSVKFNWSADAGCDYAWYSTDNGGSWHDLPANNIITGLSAGTSYNFKLRVRRTDSQLTTDSGTYTQSTYDYPKCTDSPNFTIGDNLTLTLSNPLSRQCLVEGLSESNVVLFSASTNGTSVTNFIDSTAIDNLYQSIPNSKKGKYKVRVTYNSNVRLRENNNEYSVNEEEAKPLFEDFTYSDSNSTIQDLVQNNQVLVDGYSTPLFAISSVNKAVARKYSQIDKYRVEWGATNDEVAYSDDDVSKQIGTGSGDTIKVTVFDTRGLTRTVVKKITNVVYVNAVVNSASTQRQNGVEAKTFIEGKFTIWKGNWQGSNNTDFDNRLKYVGYRVFDGTSWSQFFDITNEVLEVIHSTDFENSKKLEFSISDQIDIHSNGVSGGFTVGSSFIIQVLIKDGTKDETFTSGVYQAILQTEVSDGKVYQSVYKDSNGDYHQGINGMPNEDYTSDIHGQLNVEKLYVGGVLVAWTE